MDLERRRQTLCEALDHAGGLMEVPISAKWENMGDAFEGDTQRAESTKEIQSLWDSVKHVQGEIRRCEDEMQRLKLTAAEQAKRERDKKLEKQRQERQKQAELLRKQREREAALEKEEQLKREQREQMKKVLQQSLEKQEKEKKAGICRRVLVDPSTQLPLTEPPSVITSPVLPSRSGSMDMMEYQVSSLLEDDSPVRLMEQRTQLPSSFQPPEPPMTVKGVLESLNDPWDVQSETEEMRPALFTRQNSALLPGLSAHLDRETDFTSAFPQSVEVLLAKKRATESQTLTQDFRFGSQPIPSWSNPMALPMLSRRFGALDSSARAFYPSAPPEVSDYGKGLSAFSTPLHPSPLLHFPGAAPRRPEAAHRRLEIPILSQSGEVPRPAVRPFPGVGAGIPGKPSRSLSEKMDRLKPMSLTLSEKEKFSMSGEL